MVTSAEGSTEGRALWLLVSPGPGFPPRTGQSGPKGATRGLLGAPPTPRTTEVPPVSQLQPPPAACPSTPAYGDASRDPQTGRRSRAPLGLAVWTLKHGPPLVGTAFLLFRLGLPFLLGKPRLVRAAGSDFSSLLSFCFKTSPFGQKYTASNLRPPFPLG